MEMRDPAFDKISIGIDWVELLACEIVELAQINVVGLSGSFRALTSSKVCLHEGCNSVSN